VKGFKAVKGFKQGFRKNKVSEKTELPEKNKKH